MIEILKNLTPEQITLGVTVGLNLLANVFFGGKSLKQTISSIKTSNEYSALIKSLNETNVALSKKLENLETNSAEINRKFAVVENSYKTLLETSKSTVVESIAKIKNETINASKATEEAISAVLGVE